MAYKVTQKLQVSILFYPFNHFFAIFLTIRRLFTNKICIFATSIADVP